MKAGYRILYFSSQFPTPAWPHLGMFSLQRTRALKNAGCQVVVICPVLITLPARLLRKPSELFPWVKEQLSLSSEGCVEGIQTFYPKWVWFPKGLFGWYTSDFLYWQVRKRVMRLVRELHPDVILSSWLPDGVAASRLGQQLGLPTISIADGSDVNRLPHSYLGWQYACRCLNRPSSTVVFVSKALQVKANSLGLYGGQSAVLYNAVDVRLFQPGSAKPDHDVFTVLSVGRLVPVKGFEVLLAAFAKLYQHLRKRSRLILVGEGPLLEALTQEASQLDILPWVDFVGAIPQKQIVSYYQHADVFCLSSFSEGSPSVIVEAMACGKPVVATDVGGVGELVTPETGILVDPGNPELIYAALLQAKNRVWDGEAIRREAENRFAWGKWTEGMLALIQASQLKPGNQQPFTYELDMRQSDLQDQGSRRA